MNWLFINGSPRKNGNTIFMCNQIKESFCFTNDNIETIVVYEKNIRPCIDCRACKTNKLICTVNDDMQILYTAIESSDITVFASPVYWSGITGPMKNVIDRLRPYYKNKKLNNKRIVILSVGANADTESDLIDEMYKRITEGLGINIIGNIKVNGFDEEDIKKSGYSISNNAIQVNRE